MDGTINGKSGQYVLLADYIVSSATTNVDFTGLNIGKEEEIVLVCDINNLNVNNTFGLFVNGNYTNSNYYNQYITANSTSITANRANYNWFAYDSQGLFYFNIKIKLVNNGYFVYQSNGSIFYGGSSNKISNFYNTSTFTLSSITSLRISGGTNSIGIGSRFQLYKIGA